MNELQSKIDEKIALSKKRLLVIQNAMDEEMSKGYYERDKNLLDFLYKEKSIYQYNLIELESLAALTKNE